MSATPTPKMVGVTAQASDVLLGRGRGYRKQAGNNRFNGKFESHSTPVCLFDHYGFIGRSSFLVPKRLSHHLGLSLRSFDPALIRLNCRNYFAADFRGKNEITSGIVKEVLKTGRFLKKDKNQKDTWIVASKETAHVKVAHAFQYLRRQRPTLSPTAGAAPQPNLPHQGGLARAGGHDDVQRPSQEVNQGIPAEETKRAEEVASVGAEETCFPWQFSGSLSLADFFLEDGVDHWSALLNEVSSPPVDPDFMADLDSVLLESDAFWEPTKLTTTTQRCVTPRESHNQLEEGNENLPNDDYEPISIHEVFVDI